MHFSTHIQIGNCLYAGFNLEQKKTIGKGAFVFGNIKPDLIRKGTWDLHVFTKTRYVMRDIINHLIKINNQKPKVISEETILLGVLCHHVIDIFCRYHHDEKIYLDLYSHYLYEVGLHRHFCRLIHENKLDKLWDSKTTGNQKRMIPFSPFHNHFHADDYIDQLISEVESYSQEEPSFDLDIRYSLSNCCNVIETFLPFICQDRQVQMPQIHFPETESIYWRDAI